MIKVIIKKIFRFNKKEDKVFCIKFNKVLIVLLE